jgi:glycosyltransferase involved in cell wall biosynthesis
MSRLKKKQSSICIITCYRQPDYLRAVTLRRAVTDSNVFNDITIIKNTSTGAKRYLEVIGALIKVRWTKNPDVYLITFRGYEILPFVLLIGIGKKIIYDEFINPVEWFVYEHKIFVGPLAFMGSLLTTIYSIMMKLTAAIMTDTASHAQFSSRLMSVNRDKYFVVPVGADETVFKQLASSVNNKRPFRVLYYGSMVPLHGISYVLDATVALRSRRDIEFYIVGGKKATFELVKAAQLKGANITYEPWVEYKKLPALFATSDLVLGGPFGDTVQSHYVVTGKTYQSLASARPVVVGDNQETKLFSDKKNALIVKQADSQALVNAVSWSYDHPKQLEAIAKNGRRLYEKEFSSDRIASHLGRFFTTKHIL